MKGRPRSAVAIPPEVCAWFSGTERVQAAGWVAVLPADEATLLRWWAEWRRQNPKARPPVDAPWINWSTTHD